MGCGVLPHRGEPVRGSERCKAETYRVLGLTRACAQRSRPAADQEELWQRKQCLCWTLKGRRTETGRWVAGPWRWRGQCVRSPPVPVSVSVCQEPTPEVAGGAWQWQRSKETHLSSLCWRPWNGCSNLSLRLATCPVLLYVQDPFKILPPYSLNPFFSLDWFNNWLLLFATKIVLMSVNPCFWWCYFIYLYPAT